MVAQVCFLFFLFLVRAVFYWNYFRVFLHTVVLHIVILCIIFLLLSIYLCRVAVCKLVINCKLKTEEPHVDFPTLSSVIGYLKVVVEGEAFNPLYVPSTNGSSLWICAGEKKKKLDKHYFIEFFWNIYSIITYLLFVFGVFYVLLLIQLTFFLII